ncbi:MAG: nitroreductase family protein [Actinomycetes bacterium]
MTTPSGGPPFYDVLTRQRACREFLPDPVPDDLINRILTAATHAPSAENSQPWRFVVVRDAKKRKAIADLATKVWTGGARQHSAPKLAEKILEDVDRSMMGGAMAGAPVIVVVCGDPANTFPSAMESSIWPCVQNLLLAADAEGLGASLTTMATLIPDQLRALLELPDDITPYAAIPLGKPVRPLGPPRRRNVNEVTHLDGWTPQGK